jgi:hypothetical protein
VNVQSHFRRRGDADAMDEVGGHKLFSIYIVFVPRHLNARRKPNFSASATVST